MARFPVVEVRWMDSMSYSGWQEQLPDGLVDNNEHVTVGFLVNETKRVVVVSSSISDLDNAGDYDKHLDPLAIPKSAILSRKIIRKASNG